MQDAERRLVLLGDSAEHRTAFEARCREQDITAECYKTAQALLTAVYSDPSAAGHYAGIILLPRHLNEEDAQTSLQNFETA